MIHIVWVYSIYEAQIHFLFFYLCSDWLEHGLRVYEVESSTCTRRKFRQVARETCGESMEPPADNLILFGEVSGNKG